MSSNYPTNSDDIIDSRDVIARLRDLESELEDAKDGQGGNDEIDFDEWVEETADDDLHTMQDAAYEYSKLKAVADECEGYGDWRYGEALIRDSYFEEYARQTAEDIGAINGAETWPCDCIDWEKAADALKQDYAAVDFDGETYWIRG